jgi:flagellar basal-body rod protein FlgF
VFYKTLSNTWFEAKGAAPSPFPPASRSPSTRTALFSLLTPAQTGAVPQTLIGRLLLRDASTTQLERRDDGLFGPMGKLGADVTGGPKLPSLTAGALEGSNVNAMMAMVKLMDQSRSFEHQVRNIKESKNADEAGATMLKLN